MEPGLGKMPGQSRLPLTISLQTGLFLNIRELHLHLISRDLQQDLSIKKTNKKSQDSPRYVRQWVNKDSSPVHRPRQRELHRLPGAKEAG